MEIVAIPVDCIALFNKEGVPKPIKFRIVSDMGDQTIKVNQIIHTDIEKLAGNPMYIFNCRSSIRDTNKNYQLKYELSTCKWMLYKI